MTNPEQDQPAAPGKPRRRTKRNVVVLTLGILLLTALVAGGYLLNLAHTFNSTTQTIETAFPQESTRPSEETTAAPGDDAGEQVVTDGNHSGEEVNMLLLGSDSGDSQVPVPGAATGRRSAAIMLMHIPADRENVYVMSIMRDLWTQIPGHGMHKINAAFSLGGIPLAVQTVEGLFDERIDHVISVDFAGFKDLTNALGGVQVEVPQTFTTSGPEPETFTKGPATLDGESALKFVRERKAFATGGYQRVANQQLFVKSVMEQFLDSNMLAKPVRVHGIVSDFSPYLRMDEGLDAGTVAGLALSLRDLETTDVELFTLPTNGLGTSPGGASIVLKNRAAIADISRTFDDGSLTEYLKRRGLAESNH